MISQPGEQQQPLDRRQALGIAAVVMATPVVASCGSKDSQPTVETSGAGGEGSVLAQTTDIPVGGGKIITAEKVVVTQPQQGDFKAFSAICTHQGCPVNEITGETVNCPCHGSKFSIVDGSVVDGPASKALPEIDLNISGTSITRA